jgi:hypothetical protein
MPEPTNFNTTPFHRKKIDNVQARHEHICSKIISPEQKLVDDLYYILDSAASYQERQSVRECIELVLIYLSKPKSKNFL